MFVLCVELRQILYRDAAQECGNRRKTAIANRESSFARRLTFRRAESKQSCVGELWNSERGKQELFTYLKMTRLETKMTPDGSPAENDEKVSSDSS